MITKKEILALIPIAVFLAVSIHLGVALFNKTAHSEVAEMQKDLPEFKLFKFSDEFPPLSSTDIKEGVHILNFFASWCAPCKAEHANLFKLKREGVTLHGIYYMDNKEDIQKYLTELDNPYDTVSEENRKLADTLGVIGLPETYIVNAKTQKIIFHQLGPIMLNDVQDTVLPLIEKTLLEIKNAP